MHGLYAQTKFYRRPEFQLPVVAMVATLFALVTYMRWIPSTTSRILGISFPSEIIALGFAVIFALLAIAAFAQRENRREANR